MKNTCWMLTEYLIFSSNCFNIRQSSSGYPLSWNVDTKPVIIFQVCIKTEEKKSLLKGESSFLVANLELWWKPLLNPLSWYGSIISKYCSFRSVLKAIMVTLWWLRQLRSVMQQNDLGCYKIFWNKKTLAWIQHHGPASADNSHLILRTEDRTLLFATVYVHVYVFPHTPCDLVWWL